MKQGNTEPTLMSATLIWQAGGSMMLRNLIGKRLLSIHRDSTVTCGRALPILKKVRANSKMPNRLSLRLAKLPLKPTTATGARGNCGGGGGGGGGGQRRGGGGSMVRAAGAVGRGSRLVCEGFRTTTGTANQHAGPNRADAPRAQRV